MTVFSWCALGPPGSIPDHNGCPGVIGGPDGLVCSCGCHSDEAEES
jgi:hypothetical protein